MQGWGYRIGVIAILPQIHTLDDTIITADERTMALQYGHRGNGYVNMHDDWKDRGGDRGGNGVIQ